MKEQPLGLCFNFLLIISRDEMASSVRKDFLAGLLSCGC